MRKFLIVAIALFSLAPIAHAAIVFDNAADGGGNSGITSLTYSFTVTSTANTILIVGVRQGSSGAVTVTYNGSAMTKIGESIENGDTVFEGMWYMLNPPSGAHNVFVSSTVGAVTIQSGAVSYAGVAQAGPEATSSTHGSGATASGTLTTITNNDWHIMMCGAATNCTTAGTGTTKRTGISTTAAGLYDSGGPITPAAKNTLKATVSTSNSWGTLDMTIQPFVAASTVTTYRNFVRFIP